MTAEPGLMLTERAVQKLAAMVRRLEGEVQQLKQRLGQTLYPVEPPQLAFGKVTRRNDSDFPDQSNEFPENFNVFWVEWANAAFDYALAADVAGGLSTVVTVTSSPDNFVQARSMYGEGVPEDTTHVIERHWTLDGPRYWIRPMGNVEYRAKAVEAIVVGGTGMVDCLDGDDNVIMRVKAYYTWMITNAEDIEVDQELIVKWREQDGRWMIDDADCI